MASCKQAGGLGITGMNRVMDIMPQTVHQRVPCFLGSPEDILELKRYYDESKDESLKKRCKERLAPKKATSKKQ